MILPLGDDNSDRRITPYVTYIFIGLNILVFALFQGFGNDVEFTYAYSTVPAEILSGEDIATPDRVVQDPSTGQRYRVPGLQPTPIPVLLTLLTSMFMHGGFAHILGNMLYLFIFGDNIEDRVGHGRFILFYLLCGIAASFAHIFASAALGADLQVPTLGASGAISGVLGGYLLLFPKKRVHVILLRIIMPVPALVAIGIWFAFQLLNGLGALGQSSGVAYGAHIGGFIAGLILVKMFDPGAPTTKGKGGRRASPRRRTPYNRGFESPYR
jgi:membrane associated rhomboid family serine protease